MTLEDAQKVQVLVAALQERYQAMRTIRDRVQSIGIWALGLLTAAGGWVIQTDETLTRHDRMFFALGVIGALGVLRLIYLADLEKGFNAQQRTAARLEAALGFYEAGALAEGSTPLYPASWADAGKEEGKGRFFQSSYALLYVGSGFLLLALAFR